MDENLLSAEEAAVLTAASRAPRLLLDVVRDAVDFYPGPRFDKMVAIKTAGDLLYRKLLEKEEGTLRITTTGIQAVKHFFWVIRIMENAAMDKRYC